MIQTASYLPWFFLAGLNFWDRPGYRKMIFLMIVTYLMVMSGHFQLFFICFLSLFIFIIIRAGKDKPNVVLKKFLLFTLAFLLASLVTSIQLLPTLELLFNSIRVGLVSVQDVASLRSIKQFATIINPNLFGNPLDASYKPLDGSIFWESTIYIGIIPLLFSIYGIFGSYKKNVKTKFIWLFFITVILSFGPHSPIGFVYLMPVFSSMRGAVRFFLVAIFSLTILSGFGLDRVVFKYERRRGGNFWQLGLGLVIVVTIFELYKFGIKYQPVLPIEQLLESPEIVNYIPKGDRVFTDYSQQENYNKTFMKEGWADLSKFLYLKNGIDENSNLLYGIGNLKVYSAMPITRQSIVQRNINYNLVNLAGANYIVSMRDLDNDENLNLIYKSVPFADLPSYFLYKNSNAIPRIRFVDDYEIKKFDLETYTTDFQNIGYSLRNAVFLEEGVSLADKKLSESKVNIVKDDNRNLTIKTYTNADAILVLADTYYPGWKAYVNGKRVKIYPANINQRAIVLPEGENMVEFIYKPMTLYLGGCISLLTLAFLVMSRRRLKEIFKEA